MKLFLDSNVVIDGLVDRSDSHRYARLMLALGYLKELDLWVSPSQWTDIYYILSEGGKPSRRVQVVDVLKKLRESVRIGIMGEDEIDQAMALEWEDLEDATVYAAARAVNPRAIITENSKDFQLSEIPVYSCKGFFEWQESENGICYSEIDL